MSEKKLTRRERERLRQRQDILDAAVELFSEKGYHNVSINEIAARSEFAIGTLYKFFKSKEDLYRSLFREKADAFEAELDQALGQGENEVAQLRNFIKTKSRLFKRDQASIRLYFAETSGSGFTIKADMDAEQRQRHERFMQKIVAVFKSGIAKGLFKDKADPYHLAVALEGITNSFLYLLVEETEEHPYPEDDTVILDIFLDGLMTQTPEQA